jgi:hypothetical protein
MKEKTIFEIRIPRENEYTPEAAAALFAGFTKTLSSPSFLDRLKGKEPEPLILEIACHHQEVHFYTTIDSEMSSFFESQILGAYPLAILTPAENYLDDWPKEKFFCGQLVQSTSHYYPLKTYKEFTDVDPLASTLAVMSKASEDDFLLIQFVIQKAPSGWQGSVQKAVEAGIKVSEEERKPLPGEALIKQKIQEEGLKVGLRLAATDSSLLKSLAGSLAGLNRGDGNSLVFRQPNIFQRKKFKQAVFNHSPGYTPRFQIFSISELATLWHLPGQNIKVPNIAWGRAVINEPPEDLPASINLTDEQKAGINFFARTEFKNKIVTFGIKETDRRRHIYIIGKTGTGKSWLLANMAIDDLKKKRGVAVIDPHGDLSEILLKYIPSHRINDVCYFDPSDKDNPIAINILEVTNPAQAELVASGILSIFYKLYAHSWGPRMEYIFRNTLLTLTQTPNSTLVDVVRILTNKKYRDKVTEKLEDKVLSNFWNKEFNRMPDRLREEAISPILNKAGQFVTSPLIRQVIERQKSTVDLEKIMNEGKILIVNLSQGKLGEDNAALLGAMIITKLQLAAMRRAHILEEKRRDFYLYVDEFQNFATDSFIKILSEARKYRLNLTLANQYMAQIDEPVQKAILGNAGTLISFILGADDARILEKEFGEVFVEKDLVNLGKFQIAVKLMIDDLTSRPFLAQTLPLPKSVNQNREKVLRVSRERYSYKK